MQALKHNTLPACMHACSRLLTQLSGLQPNLCVLSAADQQVRGALFIFCCMWSIGALLVQQPDVKDRDRFDALMKQLAALGTVDSDRVPAGQLPAQSLYEYCFDVADGCWRSWRSYVSAYTPPAGGQFSKILVATADTVR